MQQTRGLNKNFNRTLKAIFKGAAITVIGQRRDKPYAITTSTCSTAAPSPTSPG